MFDFSACCVAGAQVGDGGLFCFVLGIYLAVLGLCGCPPLSRAAESEGCSVIVVPELLIVLASLVQHRL